MNIAFTCACYAMITMLSPLGAIAGSVVPAPQEIGSIKFKKESAPTTYDFKFKAWNCFNPRRLQGLVHTHSLMVNTSMRDPDKSKKKLVAKLADEHLQKSKKCSSGNIREYFDCLVPDMEFDPLISVKVPGRKSKKPCFTNPELVQMRKELDRAASAVGSF